MKVSIIIPNWNGEHLLKTCLPTLKAHTKIEYELIVVDNGSTDNSVKYLEKQNVKVIKNGENLGFSKAINIGTRISRGEYILWLNNDIIIKADGWLKYMVDEFNKIPNCGAVGPSGGRIHPTTLQYIGGYHPFYKGEVEYIEGWCLLTSKKVLDDVGFLDEDFFMFAEDSEWCFRAKKKGYKIIQIPNVPILHLGSMTVKNQVKGNPGAVFDYREISEQSRLKLKEKISSFSSPEKEKILVIRLHARGDILNVTPAIKQLKKEKPSTFIGFLCLEECVEMVENNPFIDKVFVVKKGVVDSELFTFKWDKVYNLSDRRYSFLDRVLPQILGDCSHYREGHELMKSDIETRRKRGELKRKYVDIFAEIMEVTLSDRRPVFVSSPMDTKIAGDLFPRTSLKKIVLGLDSGWPSRNYPDKYTENLIDILSKDFFVILVGLFRGKYFRERKNFLNLLGKTKRVGIAFEILKRADLFVGVDSLLIHLAACLDLPTVSIWNVTEPYHVLGRFPSKFVSLEANVPCGPCYFERCVQKDDLHYICFKQLFPARIVEAVKELMK